MAHLVQFFNEGGGFLLRGLAFQYIKSLAVGTGDERHIIHALHASFNLQAVNPSFLKVGKVVNHAQILGRKHGGKVVAFVDGKVFVGTLPFAQYEGRTFCKPFCPATINKHIVIPAAGMGTKALLRAPPVQVGAHQAASRVCNAHCSMHKTFYLHFWHSLLYLGNLL